MRSLTGDWTQDLPHSKPALYHQAIEEEVFFIVNKYIRKDMKVNVF